MATVFPKLLTSKEAARALRISRTSLLTRAFRERHGLIGVRLGKRLLFAEEDLAAFVTARRERRAGELRPEAPVGRSSSGGTDDHVK